MDKEIILKLDDGVIDRLAVEIREKRRQGQANAFTDVFLIRLLDSLNNNNRTQVFKLRQSKPSK
jgi:hypothetical protein